MARIYGVVTPVNWLWEWHNMCFGNTEFLDDQINFYGKIVLFGKYQHWCADWDFLPIDETCEEFKACTCYRETSKCEAQSN